MGNDISYSILVYNKSTKIEYVNQFGINIFKDTDSLYHYLSDNSIDILSNFSKTNDDIENWRINIYTVHRKITSTTIMPSALDSITLNIEQENTLFSCMTTCVKDGNKMFTNKEKDRFLYHIKCGER